MRTAITVLLKMTFHSDICEDPANLGLPVTIAHKAHLFSCHISNHSTFQFIHLCTGLCCFHAIGATIKIL